MAQPRRRRAFLMVYAIGTLTLIASLSLSMLESTSSEMEIAKTRMYLAMARIAAESGIEYAMGFVNRELGKEYDPFAGIPGGPWTDPTYRFNDQSYPWYYSKRAFTSPLNAAFFTSLNSQAEGTPVRLHQLMGGATGAVQQATQFQVAMTPEPTYGSVRLATNQDQPTVFVVRSRGELLADADGPGGNPPTVLASAYAQQTFLVGLPETCLAPKLTRQVFDRQPATLRPQGLPPPNPH